MGLSSTGQDLVIACCEDSKDISGCREWGWYLDRLSFW